MNPPARPDAAARFLEWGLMLAIIAGPFPFGAVQPSGRLALELLALGLMAVWVARAPFRATPLPPRLGQIGVAGLLLLCALQALPLGRTIVGAISPQAVSIRADSLPADEAREAERNLLGLDSARLDPPVSLSLDPGASASALRTGAALAALFYVATTVVDNILLTSIFELFSSVSILSVKSLRRKGLVIKS